jgi:tetratricopeptide (TPR) repeat protein
MPIESLSFIACGLPLLGPTVSRFSQTLRLGIVVGLLAIPFQASAFKVGREPNGNVIIFDNDYLDRRYGRTWVPESSITNSPSAARWSEVQPDRSLLTAISRSTPARRAAALRLAETGRISLQKGQHRKAIYYLEKALSCDAGPFIHFYLARAHYQLADYEQSRGFLEVAESAFNGQPEWLPKLEALKRDLSAHRAASEGTIRRDAAWTANK